MRKGKALLSFAVAFTSLALTACPERIRVAQIQRDPGRYYQREVTVVGRVTRSYGAMGQGVYEIDDGTGRIWVATEKYGVPGKDSIVGVSGRIYPGLSWEGRMYGLGMRETRRRTHPTS